MAESTPTTMLVTGFWVEPDRWKDEDGPDITKVMKVQLTAIPASEVRNMAESVGELSGAGQQFEFALQLGGAAKMGELLLRASAAWDSVPESE